MRSHTLIIPVVWLCALLFGGSAFAQSTVFVPFVKTADPSLMPLAKQLDQGIDRQVSEVFTLLSLDSVPDFEDYGADIYLEACPPNEDIGCVFVVAGRVNAPVALVMRLARRSTQPVLTVSILDIEAASTAVSFSLNVFDDNIDTTVVAVVRALEALGSQENADLRAGSLSATPLVDRRARIELALQNLGVTVTLETMLRVHIEPPVFTVKDLDTWAEMDAVTPWEQAGLSQREFVRYKNANTTLERWTTRNRGTLGSVVIESRFGFVGGPLDQSFSASYLQRALSNGQGFSVIETDAVSGVVDARVGVGQLAVGLGIHRTTEILATLAFYGGRYEYLETHEEVGDLTNFPGTPVSRGSSSRSVGLQINMTARPDLAVRPTLTTSVSRWSGREIDDAWEISEHVESIPAPQLWFVMVEPGLSASLSPAVSLLVRAQLGYALGALSEQAHTGGSDLSLAIEDPDAGRFMGGLSIGVSTRFGSLFGRNP